jgi:type II secretory pathway component PulF
MRTTVTLEPDAEALIRKAMRERGLTFKQALNEAIRAGLAPETPSVAFRTRTFSMGFNPAVPLDKALRLAAELEDEELLRRLTTHK